MLTSTRINPQMYRIKFENILTNAVIDGQSENQNDWKLVVDGEWVHTFESKKECLIWLWNDGNPCRVKASKIKAI